jgi:large subunit ribosomal protein L19
MLSSLIPKTPSFSKGVINIIRKNACSFQALSFSTVTKESPGGVAPEEMPYHHFRVSHSKSSNNEPRVKFNSPRKRANKMFSLIQNEAMEKEQEKKKNVHDVHFRVGDAIEMTMISQGGVDSTQTEKIRGVVLGIDKRGLGTGIYLRDVVFGEPIDRKIPLYSPLLKEIKLLEENFVFKKKRKVKRAKLYYLRERGAQGMFEISFFFTCWISLILILFVMYHHYLRNSSDKVVNYNSISNQNSLYVGEMNNSNINYGGCRSFKIYNNYSLY